MSEKGTDENMEGLAIRQALEALPREAILEALSAHSASDSEDQVAAAQATLHTITHSQSFSGPLPPPQVLQQYNAAHPDLANRIVQMAENEQAHRHLIENTALQGSINAEKRGQRYALAICMVVVLASFGIIWKGYQISGTILAGGTLSTLAYVFITGRKEKETSEDSARS
jgi:uncharacterized membrane protein